MKRLHAHVAVKDLQTSIRFYSQSFAAQHLGSQVEERTELAEVYERLQRAEGPVIEEGETTCCYAQSEKSWIDDPQAFNGRRFSLPVKARSTERTKSDSGRRSRAAQPVAHRVAALPDRRNAP